MHLVHKWQLPPLSPILTEHDVHNQNSPHHLCSYNLALNWLIWPPALQPEVPGDKVSHQRLLFLLLSDSIGPLTTVAWDGSTQPWWTPLSLPTLDSLLPTHLSSSVLHWALPSHCFNTRDNCLCHRVRTVVPNCQYSVTPCCRQSPGWSKAINFIKLQPLSTCLFNILWQDKTLLLCTIAGQPSRRKVCV